MKADARALPVPDAWADLVITSPPYCTRLDYVVGSSLELAVLGLDPSSAAFLDLRRRMMGTPLMRTTGVPEADGHWCHSSAALLKAIREHPSADSHSYYYKSYWQYFSDAAMALRELHRVLAPGGRAVLVLQTSYYKELEVDLPLIYADLAARAGFKSRTLASHSVKRVISTMNSRSLRHRRDRQYREDVIALQKGGD